MRQSQGRGLHRSVYTSQLDPQSGRRFRVVPSPSSDAGRGFYGPLGKGNLADEVRIGWLKPGATFYARPLLQRVLWNFGRRGFLTEVWANPDNIVGVLRIGI